MNKETLIKLVLVFGGAGVLYYILKPKQKVDLQTVNKEAAALTKTSFDSTTVPAPTLENAEIVANAYAGAMQAGEPATQLTELNKECMKDFGMRCYMDKEGKLIVCDVTGNVIMSK